ncbi:MAG: iron dependent repressor, metal binding and dimerization domain protein [Melioribacteraceae bacterium]|nr:FeoA domain-containing protein [Melioribacteraceae bacterium]WKZ68595.1 MAG: iron dependent repressor, metal binding and dimerization domain protein [Melioribacteraceae bacterium]
MKHIYDCEYNQAQSSLNSIAGNLNITSDKAAKLISKLAEMGLVYAKTDKVTLTQEGRSYALRVIRIHRLWERYLADQTSLRETEWHAQAEEREHHLTEEQANVLAAQIGNPVVDPHGDPIPSSDGIIKEKRGVSILKLDIGQLARIVHIEDEPNSVYSQIVASGIHLGMQIRILENSKDKIKFIAEGEEILLSPLIASNLTVMPESKSEDFKKDTPTLSSLKAGEEAEVIGISKACRGQQRRRIMDLGIVNGTKIRYEMESAGKDPIAYSVRGSMVALRKAQADQIFISKKGIVNG